MTFALIAVLVLAVGYAVYTAGYWFPPARRALGATRNWLWRLFDAVADPVQRGWRWTDGKIVLSSRLFLTHSHKTFRRWSAFLGWYAGILLLVWLVASPWLAVPLMLFALWGVLAIHRAWVGNEKARSKIAKKIDPEAAKPKADVAAPPKDTATPTEVPAIGVGWVNGEYVPTPTETSADRQAALTTRMLVFLRSTPDLRWQAVVAAVLLLFAVIPLLFANLHAAVGLYIPNRATALPTDPPPAFVADAVSPSECLWQFLDTTYLKGVVDLFASDSHTRLEVGRPFVQWLTKSLVHLFLILGLFRVLQILDDIKEGILGVRQDPDMAVLLGKRAVPYLRDRLLDPATPEPVVEKALLALGKLRDATTFELLHDFAVAPTRPERVRVAATLGLGHLGSPLAGAPLSPRGRERMQTVSADIVTTLAAFLASNKSEAVREAAAVALGMVDHPAAPRALLDRLAVIMTPNDGRPAETQQEVRKHIAQALGDRLGDGWTGTTPTTGERETLKTEAVNGILTGGMGLLGDTFLRVINRAATALGALGRPAESLPPMLQMLAHNDNPKLLVAGVRAVGKLAVQLPADSPLRVNVVNGLLAVLGKPNSGIRVAVGQALGAMANGTPDAATRGALGPLVTVLEAAYQSDDNEVIHALVPVLEVSFGARERAERVRREFSFDFLSDQVDVVADPNASLELRLAAADKIRPLQDSVSLRRLEAVLATLLSEDLRAVLQAKADAIRQAIAKPK